MGSARILAGSAVGLLASTLMTDSRRVLAVALALSLGLAYLFVLVHLHYFYRLPGEKLTRSIVYTNCAIQFQLHRASPIRSWVVL